jgi:hypothetical protein
MQKVKHRKTLKNVKTTNVLVLVDIKPNTAGHQSLMLATWEAEIRRINLSPTWAKGL